VAVALWEGILDWTLLQNQKKRIAKDSEILILYEDIVLL